MGRTNDTKSVRQQAFNLLDKHVDIKRAAAIELVVKEFDVSSGYASSLFQAHRTLRNKSSSDNKYVTIYLVKDIRSNRMVEPYMSVHIIPNPDKHEHRSAEDAINAYVLSNTAKSNLAQQLVSA